MEEAHHQYGRRCVVWIRHSISIWRRHVINMDAGMQYGSVTPYVGRRYTIIKDVGMQYRRGTPSVQTWVCSTDQSHHQYRQGCVEDCQ